MHLQVFRNGFKPSDALRRYAETRVWLAVRHAASLVPWVGVRFIAHKTNGDRPRVTCQVDVWLRRAGLLSVRHTDTDAHVSVDCAAVRLKQAINNKLRNAAPARRAPTPTRIAAEIHGRAHAPRLAVVIVPSGRRPQLGLGPWLQARYGIEQLQTVTLSDVEWSGLASNGENPSAGDRLRNRLALSMLSRPELVVIAGSPPLDAQWDAWPRSKQDVERILHRVRSWDLPVNVVGVWVNERSTNADDSIFESEEVDAYVQSPLSVFRNRGDGLSSQWLAETAWENEGGRVKRVPKPALPAGMHHKPRRKRHVVSHYRRDTAERRQAERRVSSRHATAGVSRLRPDLARLARA